MRSSIYILVAVAALSAPGTASADRPVRVSKNVCDRWTHETKMMRGTDRLALDNIRIDHRKVDITSLDGRRAYGYGSNVSFTAWSPARKTKARARFRFVSMDAACHRVVVRYRIQRFDPKESPYG